jgi:hypothetical protein
MPRPLVFISHSTSDQPLVLRLANFLEQTSQGTIRFFVAARDLQPGSDWEGSIIDELGNADLVFACFSAKAVESHWVLFEAGYARGKGKPVIPLGLPGQPVAQIPRPVGSRQGIDVHTAGGLGRVVGAINTIFEHRHPTSVTEDMFRTIIYGPLQGGDPPKSGPYRVFYRSSSGSEKRLEAVEIIINGDEMSARTAQWFSKGFLMQNRYVGRFKFLKSATAANSGTHEFYWTGSQFEGAAQPDSQKWLADALIWRPEQAQV